MSVRSMARAAAATCVLAAALSAGAVASAQSYYDSNNNGYQSDRYQSDQYKRYHKSRYHQTRYETGRSQGRYEKSRYQNEGRNEGRKEEMSGCVMENASYAPPAFQISVSHVPDARNALKGAAVRDEDGNSIGSVRDVVASPDGQAEAIRINVGGMWGVNGKTVVVDAHDFRYESDRHELTADLSKGQIESLPGVKP